MSKALYVHVPFCDHICAYCDFTRCRYYAPLANTWLDAIAKELQTKQIQDVTTIYIGGGTPTSLSSKQFIQLLTLLQPYQHSGQEYTIEANADSLTDEKIQILKRFGINRISLGAQTFQPDLLKKIQRVADYSMIKDCIQRLHTSGIDNISIDLMYGLPEQTMALWKADLEIAYQLPIQHISLYALTIEEHSTFGRAGVKPCEDTLEAQFYEEAIAFLTKHDFKHYEISNFAKKGYASKHNIAYWNYDDFYGIGCGASGKENHVRYDNTRNLHTYVTQGAMGDIVSLSKLDEMFEMIMMGLRMRKGVSDKLFQERFQVSISDVFKDAMDSQIALGNLCFKDGYLYTTYQGMLVLHTVLVDFLPD